jgi:hypothetical protein
MVLLIFTIIWCMIMSGMVVSAVVLHDYLLMKNYDIPQTDSEMRTVLLYARIHGANEKYFPKPKKESNNSMSNLKRKLFAQKSSS